MTAAVGDFIAKVASASSSRHSGWCGFDGFIDNFVGCKPRFDGRILPLRQLLPSARMLILTQPQKIFGADFPGQSQPFRAQTNPFTGHPLTLTIVITDAEMFLEVFLGVLKVMLRLGLDHASDFTDNPSGLAASIALTHARKSSSESCAALTPKVES
jgi:hypothetical protein